MIHRVTLCSVFVVIGFVQFTSADDKILEMDAKDWKYHDTLDGLPENWTSSDLDDSQWKSGQAPLGYGDDDIKQTISFGDDESNKHAVAFFRRSVKVDDPASLKKVLGKLVCDDGCVVYVNGKEVHRYNLPKGEITNASRSIFASFDPLERHALTFLIDPAKLNAGNNVIAIRVHQVNPSSSDLALNLSLEGLTDDAAVEEAESTMKQEAQQLQQVIQQVEQGNF